MRWTGPARTAVIAVEMAGLNPFFQVTIRGTTRPLWFTIDTGSSYTLLDARTAAALKLKTEGTATIRGAGGGSVPVVLARDVGFDLLGVETSGHEVRITDLGALPAMFGHPIDGFFGYDFLRALVVTIDPDRARITVTDPAAFTYAGDGVILPLRFGGRTGRWIYVPGEVKVPGNPPEQSPKAPKASSGPR